MRNQQLERVANVFVGDWTVAITNQRWLDDNTATATGMAKGAWLEDAFVELRVWLDGDGDAIFGETALGQPDDLGTPAMHFVFGRSDAQDRFVALSHDERGVLRVFDLTMDHSAPTARDRDRLRQQVLERLGWRFHRIWSTDWFNDPQAETEKVLTAYRNAVEEIDNGRRTVEEPDEFEDAEEVVWEYDEPQRQGRRPSVRPGGSISDYSHSQLVALARWIKSDTLLRTEDQMVDEMMDELGFQRRGSRIVGALTQAIREA